METLTLSLWEDGKAMRCGACGAVPAVQCLRCGACGAVQSGTPVHRTVGMSWVSDPAAPTRSADESHLCTVDGDAHESFHVKTPT